MASQRWVTDSSGVSNRGWGRRFPTCLLISAPTFPSPGDTHPELGLCLDMALAGEEAAWLVPPGSGACF